MWSPLSPFSIPTASSSLRWTWNSQPSTWSPCFYPSQTALKWSFWNVYPMPLTYKVSLSLQNKSTLHVLQRVGPFTHCFYLTDSSPVSFHLLQGSVHSRNTTLTTFPKLHRLFQWFRGFKPKNLPKYVQNVAGIPHSCVQQNATML